VRPALRILSQRPQQNLNRYEAKEQLAAYGTLPMDGLSLYDVLIDRGSMDVVTISPKFQVVIPREIRERLGLEPGQKVQALAYENRIEFIPVRSLKSMRGFLEGMDTTVRRDRDRV
jgi:AbrB family looped-hinge helix DNA binding protein